MQEKIWVNGLYGTSNHRHNTWIAEISTNPIPASAENILANGNETSVFPNPFADLVSVKFTMKNEANCRFEIYDATGRLVKILLDDVAREGENIFSFSTSPLASGIYFLKIISNEKIIAEKKIVKE